MTPTSPTRTAVYGYSTGSWGDQLTSYGAGVIIDIVYDAIGNPTEYFNGCDYTLVWEGRQLVGAETQTGYTCTFTYGADGLRTSRTIDGVTTTYYYDGGLLISEQNPAYTIVYAYDEANSPIGMQYRDNSYAEGVWAVFWYAKNLQGDVVGIYNHAGQRVVSYIYDAWGKVTPITHGGTNAAIAAALNPFTYRGYYYDRGTELYYLQSRYYDPAVGRFISPDNSAVIAATPDALTDKNLYAYCDNNPVMRVDNGGEFWVTLGIMGVGALVGCTVSAISSVITQQALNGEVNWASVVVAAVSGFVGGAIAASPIGLSGQIVAGGVIGGLSYVADAYVNDTDITLDGVILAVGMGSLSGWIGGQGANHNMSLTRAVHSAQNAIAREARRTNQKFAQKAIASILSKKNNILSLAFYSASARFAIGTGLSNGINSWYSSNRIFESLPSWNLRN